MSQNNNPKKDVPKPIVVCGPGRTKQSFRDEVNVNSIVAKYKATGLVNHVRTNPGTYTDMSDARSYHESLNLVHNSQALFNALPSAIRTKFGNDPSQLMAFMEDKKNIPEAVKLGLLRVSRPPKSSKAAPPPKEAAAPPPTPKKEDK